MVGLELTASVEKYVIYSFGKNFLHLERSFSILLDSGLIIFQDDHEDVLNMLPHWRSTVSHSVDDLPVMKVATSNFE